MSLTAEEFANARRNGLVIEFKSQLADNSWGVTNRDTPIPSVQYRIQQPRVASRPHADLIKLWADGATIERQFGDHWAVVMHPTFQPENVYRVQPPPPPPPREFPKSSLSFETAYELLFQNPTVFNREHYTPRFQAIADAAVKQYILDTDKGK